MKKSILILLSFLCFFFKPAISQEKKSLRWWNPAQNSFPVLEGQGWPGKVKDFYDRLPRDAEKMVRKEVWNLSRNSAGLLIRFRTNSPVISVRYGLKEILSFPHMPATGVSGVDLYSRDDNGNWLWCGGNRSFTDTAKYEFTNLTQDERFHKKGREYRLYLPLYNTVKWLEIGVAPDASFEPLPMRNEKPIIVYGTSIAQGGCASRPGMAWTAILERHMDRPLINLGFSGNGRMEKEVIDQMTQIDAKIYILDCLPNLSPKPELENLLVSSVKRIREKRPSVPILMVEYADYGGDGTSKSSKTRIDELNEISQKAYTRLKAEGIRELYYLDKSQLGLDMECFVDGVHPTDLGMLRYAQGYERCLRSILNEQTGHASTSNPVTQRREPDKYDWEKRHQDILKLNKTNPSMICILGNSIIHYWGGTTAGPFIGESKVWIRDFESIGVRNLGFGWDRIENVLWRVHHDELDGYSLKKVLIMIGTNNLSFNNNKEILEGLKYLVQAVQIRQPQAAVILCGLLPRSKLEKEIVELNQGIAQLSGELRIQYTDFGEIFLGKNGMLDESLFSDGLHPNARGYEKLTPLIEELINK